MVPAQVLYREHAPHPALLPFVRTIWTLRADEPAACRSVEPVYPDGCVEWIVHFGDPCFAEGPRGGLHEQGRQLVAGPGSTVLRLLRGAHTDVLGVRFEPGAARAAGLPPLHELRDRIEEVAALSLPALRDGAAALHAAGDDGARIRRVQALLLELVSGRRTAPAVALARAARAGERVTTLARRHGLSVRSVERLFESEVGLSPRSLRGIARFRRALAELSAADGIPLADVAQRAGYADQAHLCRDFRRHAGITPSEHRRRVEPLTAAFGAGA